MFAYQLPLFRAMRETAPEYAGAASAAVSATLSTAIVPGLADAIKSVHKSFCDRLSDAQAQRLGKRIERGLEIALQLDQVLSTEDPAVFKVRSASTRGNYYYTVTLPEAGPKSCTCPDFKQTPGIVCKHILAAYFMAKAYELLGELPITEGLPADAPASLASPATAEPAEPAPAAPAVMKPHPDLSGIGRYFDDVITLATLDTLGELILVEVLEFGAGGQAFVRTLPILDGDGRTVPYFPFCNPYDGTPDSYSTAFVPVSCLHQFRIFTHGKDFGPYENFPLLPEVPARQ